MPDVTITLPDGFDFYVARSAATDGNGQMNICVYRKGLLLEHPVGETAAEATAAIEARMVKALHKPGMVGEAIRKSYGIDASNLSISARSNVETSGRATSPSNTCRKRVTSSLPSWALAVTTAPIISTTVPKALATAASIAAAGKSSIGKILSSFYPTKARPLETDSATPSSEERSDA